MTDLIEADLRHHLEMWAAEVEDPPMPDIAAIEQEGRLRVIRRRGWIAAAAAAVVVLVVVTSISWTLHDTGGKAPTPPVVTPITPDVSNGRIVSAYNYLADANSDCEGCRSLLTAYDADSGTGLFLRDQSAIVVNAEGRLADISCPEELACQGDLTGGTLGPRAGEITLLSHEQRVQVLGYDGTVRRTLDLSPALGTGETVRELAWSPDRSRLAVTTWKTAHSARVGRVWLFDSEGGAAQLAYTTPTFPAPDCRTPLGVVHSPSWSPDGSRIAVIEIHTRTYCQTLIQVGTRASTLVVLQVPPAGQRGGATSRRFPPVTHGSTPQFAWSPDGARIAVNVTHSLLELSADDGTVLARRRHHSGPVIWLRGRH